MPLRINKEPTIDDYHSFVAELASQHIELGQVELAEAQQKAEVYEESRTESVSGREQEAFITTIEYHRDIIEIRSRIKALEVGLNYIERMLFDGNASGTDH